MSKKLKPNFDQARKFFDALDPQGRFTFQTFGEGSAKPNSTLVSILHGGLEKHAAELERLQQQGAGVFVTVNETDGNGRNT